VLLHGACVTGATTAPSQPRRLRVPVRVVQINSDAVVKICEAQKLVKAQVAALVEEEDDEESDEGEGDEPEPAAADDD
jgi:hypothetical protein